MFVLSHKPRERVVKQGGTTYTFVTEGIESALEQARAAAGDKHITLAGAARAIHQYLQAGLLDQLHLTLVPVLLGEGIRLCANNGTQPIELEQISVIEEPGATHFRFRVL